MRKYKIIIKSLIIGTFAVSVVNVHAQEVKSVNYAQENNQQKLKEVKKIRALKIEEQKKSFNLKEKNKKEDERDLLDKKNIDIKDLKMEKESLISKSIKLERELRLSEISKNNLILENRRVRNDISEKSKELRILTESSDRGGFKDEDALNRRVTEIKKKISVLDEKSISLQKRINPLLKSYIAVKKKFTKNERKIKSIQVDIDFKERNLP